MERILTKSIINVLLVVILFTFFFWEISELEENFWLPSHHLHFSSHNLQSVKHEEMQGSSLTHLCLFKESHIYLEKGKILLAVQLRDLEEVVKEQLVWAVMTNWIEKKEKKLSY